MNEDNLLRLLSQKTGNNWTNIPYSALAELIIPTKIDTLVIESHSDNFNQVYQTQVHPELLEVAAGVSVMGNTYKPYQVPVMYRELIDDNVLEWTPDGCINFTDLGRRARYSFFSLAELSSKDSQKN